MADGPSLGFFARLSLAFQVLFNADVAQKIYQGPVADLPAPALPPATVAPTTPAAAPIANTDAARNAGALHLLALLQREGRFVDFVMDDLTGAADADVGAAARVVHAGCKTALQQFATLKSLDTRTEGSRVRVNADFDAERMRLVGKVSAPPVDGTLIHAGWLATQAALPARQGSADAHVVAPAEIEI